MVTGSTLLTTETWKYCSWSVWAFYTCTSQACAQSYVFEWLRNINMTWCMYVYNWTRKRRIIILSKIRDPLLPFLIYGDTRTFTSSLWGLGAAGSDLSFGVVYVEPFWLTPCFLSPPQLQGTLLSYSNVSLPNDISQVAKMYLWTYCQKLDEVVNYWFFLRDFFQTTFLKTDRSNHHSSFTDPL